MYKYNWISTKIKGSFQFAVLDWIDQSDYTRQVLYQPTGSKTYNTTNYEENEVYLFLNGF